MDNFITDPNQTGFLEVVVTDIVTQNPISNATVTITQPDFSTGPITTLLTDASGQTKEVPLSAPAIEFSMQPSEFQPYSEYTITVTAPGYDSLSVSGSEIFSGEYSLQPLSLTPITGSPQRTFANIVIPANTLFGDYPAKIPESEVKPVRDTGEIVLSRVVIPEYVVVHDGAPTDSTAKNYYVRYRDYIKNVACSEIYSTWPDATIRANVLAIMSFTLNRVYTEWYRNQGYDFTITSSTAFDHKWIYGRNIFENISQIVDEMFSDYISRPNVKQPILTQYCDGQRTTCPNWMSQWGSKYLGDQNYTAIQILRYYYGEDIYINSAEEISGVPASWPGSDLTIGSSGIKVTQLQEQLNRIRQNYNAIPELTVDGIYGTNTAAAVKEFQRIFKLPQTGVVDFSTWYRISDMYVRLSRIAELD